MRSFTSGQVGAEDGSSPGQGSSQSSLAPPSHGPGDLVLLSGSLHVLDHKLTSEPTGSIDYQVVLRHPACLGSESDKIR